MSLRNRFALVAAIASLSACAVPAGDAPAPDETTASDGEALTLYPGLLKLPPIDLAPAWAKYCPSGNRAQRYSVQLLFGRPFRTSCPTVYGRNGTWRGVNQFGSFDGTCSYTWSSSTGAVQDWSALEPYAAWVDDMRYVDDTFPSRGPVIFKDCAATPSTCTTGACPNVTSYVEALGSRPFPLPDPCGRCGFVSGGYLYLTLPDYRSDTVQTVTLGGLTLLSDRDGVVSASGGLLRVFPAGNQFMKIPLAAYAPGTPDGPVLVTAPPLDLPL